jgi:hypothetical protein
VIEDGAYFKGSIDISKATARPAAAGGGAATPAPAAAAQPIPAPAAAGTPTR